MTNPLQFGHPETLILHVRVPRVVSGGIPVRDTYGMVVYDESIRTITVAAVWPLSSTRNTTDSRESNTTGTYDRTTTSYMAAVPSDFEVDAIFRVEWRGLLWEIDGESDHFQNPFTGSAFQCIRLNRVEG